MLQVYRDTGDFVAAFLTLQKLAGCALGLDHQRLAKMQGELALLAQGVQQRALHQGRSPSCPAGLYEALETSPRSTAAEIRSAYRRQAARWHPDKWLHASGEDQAEARRRFSSVQEAHATLADTHKRSLYDAQMLPV